MKDQVGSGPHMSAFPPFSKFLVEMDKVTHASSDFEPMPENLGGDSLSPRKFRTIVRNVCSFVVTDRIKRIYLYIALFPQLVRIRSAAAFRILSADMFR